MNIGVFGSRKGVNPEHVALYLNERFRPDVVLVSGGADGVDKVAEQTWRSLGGRVISFRPKMLADEEYGIERWEFGGAQPATIYMMIDHPVFGDFKSACYYRDMLIAEAADRGVAFRSGGFRSRGTTMTIDFFKGANTPCVVHDEEGAE